MRLCRYPGANSPGALRLAGTLLSTDRTLVHHVADELDALPRYPKGAVFSCPLDDGSEVLVLLAYPGGRRLTVSIGQTGCQNATNGDVGSLAGLNANRVGPRLQAELQRLTS